MTPIFLLSLPRAGSTLLQKLLSAHPSIASTGEPWILLPLVYSGKETGIVTEYGHASAYRSYVELLNRLPNGRADYLRASANMAKELYQALRTEEESHFVDKTPRYNLIIPEILEMFPDARFVFLFRNPLSVMASSLVFHGRRASHLYLCKDDVVRGTKLLSEGLHLAGDRGFTLRYEDLVSEPQKKVREVMGYLELEYRAAQLSSFSEIEFSRGDPFGTKEYKNIEKKTQEKWRKTLDTRFLARLAGRWLKEIGDPALQAQGYSLAECLNQVESLNTSRGWRSLRDHGSFVAGRLYASLQLNLLCNKHTRGIYHR